MKDILLQAIGISFLSVICDLLIPGEGIKKYARLVVGFLMMSVLIKPIDVFLPEVSFENFDYNEYSEEKLIAESDALVLGMHKDNIEKYLRDTYSISGNIFIEVYADGKIKSVSIDADLSMETLIEIQNALDCENIHIIEG